MTAMTPAAPHARSPRMGPAIPEMDASSPWVAEIAGPIGSQETTAGAKAGIAEVNAVAMAKAAMTTVSTIPTQPKAATNPRCTAMNTTDATAASIPNPSPTEAARSVNTATMIVTPNPCADWWRSEEHTSELQSRGHLVCRLL